MTGTAQTADAGGATTPTQRQVAAVMASGEVTEVASRLRQWRILLPGTGRVLRQKPEFGVHSDRNFALHGTVLDRYLQNEHQTFGINLGWTDDATVSTRTKVTRWFVDSAAEGDIPVTYGERVALGNGGDPSFIRYARRRSGINLEWSETAAYQWRLLGGVPGTPIKDGDRVAIYNERAGSDDSDGNFLIYFNRTVGGDIGWPDSKSWWQQLKAELPGIAWSIAKKAAKAHFGLEQ
ncbi:MAG: hypothetical protein QM619_02050 [Micropruina sp.]|uniref:hypothetical protein n=1 Tax=Micropruina sp. TaxID=2737536 RepID=UPI0039E485DC